MRDAMPSIQILLDQNAPIGLRHALGPHKVMTAARMGWERIENGELLRVAEEADFAVLITCDRNIRYQQNLNDRRIAVIELSTNHWAIVREHIDLLMAAIELAGPGSYVTVAFPRRGLRRRPHPQHGP